MPKAQECTDNFILTKKLFLAGLRGLQSISNPVERPCSEKVLIFNKCISGLMSNLIKKSWTDSSRQVSHKHEKEMVIHVASTFYAFCQKLTALALRYQTEIEFVQYQMRSGRCNSAACVMDIPCLLTKGGFKSERAG